MGDWYCDQVLSGAVPVDRIYESEAVLAFQHTMPYFEVHIVVIPKVHIGSLADLSESDPALAFELIQTCARICKDVAAVHGGCRVSSNVGDYQSTKHLHFYIHTGKRLRDEMGKPLPT